MSWDIASLTAVAQFLLDNITDLVAAGAAIFAGVCAIVTARISVRDKKRDREHAIRMAQVSVYETKNANAIEDYVVAASNSIIRCEITEEYKLISHRIYLHVDFRHWEIVDEVNQKLWGADFDAANKKLNEFCRLTNWAEFSKSRLAEELAVKENTSLSKRIKDKISRE